MKFSHEMILVAAFGNNPVMSRDLAGENHNPFLTPADWAGGMTGEGSGGRAGPLYRWGRSFTSPRMPSQPILAPSGGSILKLRELSLEVLKRSRRTPSRTGLPQADEYTNQNDDSRLEKSEDEYE